LPTSTHLVWHIQHPLQIVRLSTTQDIPQLEDLIESLPWDILHTGVQYDDNVSCWDVVISKGQAEALPLSFGQTTLEAVDLTRPAPRESEKYGFQSALQRSHDRFLQDALSAMSSGISVLADFYRSAAEEHSLLEEIKMKSFCDDLEVMFVLCVT